MIDKNLFAQKFALLSGRFERQLPDDVFLFYYEALNQALEEEEFIEAVRISCMEDWKFPTPQLLVDRGKASRKGTRAKVTECLQSLGMNAVLPEDWQKRTGAVIASQLSDEQAIEYHVYLRQLMHHRLVEAR